MIEGLDGMGKYLQTAAQTFQDADTQLASALGSSHQPRRRPGTALPFPAVVRWMTA